MPDTVRGRPTKGAFASLTGLTDIAKLIHQGLTSHGRLRNAGATTYKSQKTVAIDDTTQHGTLTFDDWNATVTVVAPKGAIDLSKLGPN